MDVRNEHIAFEPTVLENRQAPLWAMVGLTRKRYDELVALLQATTQEADSSTELLSMLSKRVDTPQELIMVTFLHMTYIFQRRHLAHLYE